VEQREVPKPKVWGIERMGSVSMKDYVVKYFRNSKVAMDWRVHCPKGCKRWVYVTPPGWALNDMITERVCRSRRCHKPEAQAWLVFRNGKELK